MAWHRPLPVTILPEHSDPVNRPCDERQVLNNAGGFVFKLAPMDRLRRFLILGSNSNSFYASEKVFAPPKLYSFLHLRSGAMAAVAPRSLTLASRCRS